MYKWIRTTIDRVKSYYTPAPGEHDTQVTTDPRGIATLTVTYTVLDGTDAQALLVKAKATTEFHEGATELVSNAVNTAANILTDKHSVGVMYSSIVSNMLYVPTELREKPN